MAKRLHRTTPASENHPIHRWEVANAVALAAIVPAVEDLGGVARQSSDGTHWILRSVSPVEWRQIDPSPEDMAGPSVVAQLAAEAARVAAEAAADTAQNSSGTYASTAAGLAATASGGYFYVPDGAGGLIRYLDNAGTAVEVGRVAAGAVISELVASVPPRSGDTPGHLDYAADLAGRVYRYTKADGGLMLTGREESVQARLAELDGIQVQADTAGWQDFGLDAQGRVVRAVDTEGGLRLAGRAESVQKSLTKAEALAGLLYRPTGEVVLPAGFTPMAKSLRPEERYIWCSMPAALRPDPWSRKVTIYPFEWDTQDLVVPSMMCRRIGTLATSPTQADQVTWGAEEALTVNAPAGFFDNADPNLRRQFRDGSHLYDRKTGYYWYADSGITNTASGYNCRNIPLFRSSDGLVWDFIAYTPDFLASPAVCKLATPEWFVDSDGTLYLLVSGSKDYATIPRNTWVIRCDAPDDMSAWTEIGEITGSAIPTRTAGGLPETIDCHLFTRDGVYYYIWRAESAPDGTGSEDWGQMGIAWATSLLGPYNSGHRFVDPNGAKLNGEGIAVVELPPGGPYRFRLYWDNFRDKVYGGVTAEHVWADTNDFTTFTVPRSTLLPTGTGGKDRNTAFVIGYP